MEDEDELFREDDLRDNALGKALAMTQIFGGRVYQTQPTAKNIIEIAETFYTFLKGETK
jgi:hypothetical protein